MNMLIKRRQLIMATLVVALGAAVFVNWYFTKSGSDIAGTKETTGNYVQSIGEAKSVNSDGTKTEANYFSTVKLNRQKSHDEALLKQQKILADMKEGSDEARAVADSIKQLSDTIKLESDIETLVAAKLGGDCVTVINGDSAEVVVSKGTLSDDAALQIIDIFATNTEIKTENIKITEAK